MLLAAQANPGSGCLQARSSAGIREEGVAVLDVASKTPCDQRS